jgi:hypothetical protein
MYQEGDWVKEKETGRVGILRRKYWNAATILYGNAIALRYPDQIELASLDLRSDDLRDMVELALITNDKAWFEELTCKLKVLAVN